METLSFIPPPSRSIDNAYQKLLLEGIDPVQSPRESVAMAHPLGKHVPHPADKPEETEPNTMSNKVILIGHLGQNAEAKTTQTNEEFVALNIAPQKRHDQSLHSSALIPVPTAQSPLAAVVTDAAFSTTLSWSLLSNCA